MFAVHYCPRSAPQDRIYRVVFGQSGIHPELLWSKLFAKILLMLKYKLNVHTLQKRSAYRISIIQYIYWITSLEKSVFVWKCLFVKKAPLWIRTKIFPKNGPFESTALSGCPLLSIAGCLVHCVGLILTTSLQPHCSPLSSPFHPCPIVFHKTMPILLSRGLL